MKRMVKKFVTFASGASQLVTRSTRHSLKSCDELTVPCEWWSACSCRIYWSNA